MNHPIPPKKKVEMKNFHLFLLALLCCLPMPALCGESTVESGQRWELRLSDYLGMVIQGNERVQAQLLATEAARRRSLGEKGIFEPEFTGSAQRVDNRRQNTVEQERTLNGVPILDERNKLYDAGVESLIPTGAKIRLGYTLSNLNNNLPPFGVPGPNTPRTNQWQSFTGFTVSQPLLKNAGPSFTMAGIRLAALNSESAFQEYRRELMVALAQAETAYWNLYFAQEQLKFLDDSILLAESILNDSRERLKAGKGAELDVQEAESGVALRRTKRNEALQRAADATGQLLVQAGISPRGRVILVRVTDVPSGGTPRSHGESWRIVIESNPDYVIQKRKVDEAMLRYGVARNQHLPELNLRGSYGLNGLGNSPSDASSEIGSGGFPSWTVGVEFRVPLGGGIRTGAEVSAAQLAIDQTLLQLRGLETQLGNAISTSIGKQKTSTASADDYRTMIQFNDNLLKTQQERLAVGKVDAQRVLETEAGLFEVKQGLSESLVQFKRAALELQLAEGSLLKNRNLEFTPQQLRDQTLLLLGEVKKPAKGKPATTGKDGPAPKPKAPFAPSKLKLKTQD
jgi:outer membrane protein TolC